MVKLANQFRQLRPKPLPQDIVSQRERILLNNRTITRQRAIQQGLTDAPEKQSVDDENRKGELGQEEPTSDLRRAVSGSTDEDARTRAKRSVGETLTSDQQTKVDDLRSFAEAQSIIKKRRANYTAETAGKTSSKIAWKKVN